MKSRFFLSGIAPDFARIVHSFAARFLDPLVHFILILIESLAAKDIPPRKRRWGRFHAMLEYDGVGRVDDVVPVPWCESFSASWLSLAFRSEKYGESSTRWFELRPFVRRAAHNDLTPFGPAFVF
jgi:hypothetical protein